MFIHDLDNGVEYTIVKFAVNVKLGECLVCGRARLPFRGISTSWWDGLSEI